MLNIPRKESFSLKKVKKGLLITFFFLEMNDFLIRPSPFWAQQQQTGEDWLVATNQYCLIACLPAWISTALANSHLIWKFINNKLLFRFDWSRFFLIKYLWPEPATIIGFLQALGRSVYAIRLVTEPNAWEKSKSPALRSINPIFAKRTEHSGSALARLCLIQQEQPLSTWSRVGPWVVVWGLVGLPVCAITSIWPCS